VRTSRTVREVRVFDITASNWKGEYKYSKPGLGGSLLTVKIRQPSHEFTFGVGINFIPYPLVLTPVV
jgi:hypothetical protein